MKDILMKIFLTYASISMFAGFLYGFGGMTLHELKYIKDINIGIFMILWLGPLCIAITIGGPYALYKLWSSK